MSLSSQKFSSLLICLSILFISGCDFKGTIKTSSKKIETGESATLSWCLDTYASKADITVIEPDIGLVSSKGSIDVSPAETTTYKITWTKEEQSTQASVTVYVLEPPVLNFETNTKRINKGQSATLHWETDKVSSCTIEPGIGIVYANGSLSVNPSETSTYTLTAHGQLTSITSSVTITVNSDQDYSYVFAQ